MDACNWCKMNTTDVEFTCIFCKEKITQCFPCFHRINYEGGQCCIEKAVEEIGNE